MMMMKSEAIFVIAVVAVVGASAIASAVEEDAMTSLGVPAHGVRASASASERRWVPVLLLLLN